MLTYFSSYVFISCVFGLGQSLDNNINYRTSLKNVYSQVSDGNFERAEIWRHGEMRGEDSNTGAHEFEENEENHSRMKRAEILCCNSPHLFNATARDKSVYNNCSKSATKDNTDFLWIVQDRPKNTYKPISWNDKVFRVISLEQGHCGDTCYMLLTNMISADGLATEEGVIRYIKRGTLQRWQKNIALGAVKKCTKIANKALRGKRSPQRKKTQGEPDAEMVPALRCTRVGLTFMDCMAKALDNNCPASRRVQTKKCERTEGDDMMENGISGSGQVKYENNPRRIN